jgi:hypothetical protein
MTPRILSLIAVALVGLWLPGQARGAAPEPSLRTVAITAREGTLAARVSPIPVLITDEANTTGQIRVDNISSLIEDVRISVADYSIDASGTPVAAPADFAFGSASWYRFDTPEFSLSPGTSRDIPFTMVIPDQVGAGDHFASINIIVEAQPGQDAAASDGASARSVLVIQSRLQHRISGAAPQMPTVDLSGLNGWGSVDFTARVGNAGNTVVGHQEDPTPTLALYNLMPWGDPSRPELTLAVGGFYVAPESIRDVAVPWLNPPLFGTYRAVFTLPAADGQPEIVAETTLTVVNMPRLIAIGLAIAVALLIAVLLVAMRIRHRRSRRAVRAAM